MTVFVDRLPDNASWGRWRNGAHMLGSDIDELHALAAQIGLRRSWFQDKRLPHYDLTVSKRALAVAAGAVEIEAGDIPDVVLVRRPDGTYESRAAALARRRESPL